MNSCRLSDKTSPSPSWLSLRMPVGSPSQVHIGQVAYRPPLLPLTDYGLCITINPNPAQQIYGDRDVLLGNNCTTLHVSCHVTHTSGWISYFLPTANWLSKTADRIHVPFGPQNNLSLHCHYFYININIVSNSNIVQKFLKFMMTYVYYKLCFAASP